jgi:hypothetical protein
VTAPGQAGPQWRRVPGRKVLTQFITGLLTVGAGLVVDRFGLDESSLAAGEVTAVIGILAGGIAGYLVKEIPRIEADAEKDAPMRM